MEKSLVIRIDADPGIPENGFRSRGSYGKFLIAALDLIFQVVQMTLTLLVYHLLIRKSGFCLRIPVYHAITTIYMSFIIKVNEYFDHRSRHIIVHGEFGAIPVTGSPEFLKLFQNDPAMLMGPFPGVLQKFFPGKVIFVDPLSLQFSHHLSFGCDRSMICSRHPAGIVAFKTGPANQNILDGIVEHMPHMEYTCHVRRRNNDGIGFSFVNFGMEIFILHPVFIPFLLYFVGYVF